MWESGHRHSNSSCCDEEEHEKRKSLSSSRTDWLNLDKYSKNNKKKLCTLEGYSKNILLQCVKSLVEDKSVAFSRFVSQKWQQCCIFKPTSRFKL